MSSVAASTVMSVDATSSADALLETLRASGTRVIDSFRKWDEDMSGSISRGEFRKGLRTIMRSQSAEEAVTVPTEQIDALFDAIDRDKSGTLELKELDKVLRAGYGEVLSRKLQEGGAGEIELKSENTIGLRKRGNAAPHEAGAHAKFEYASLGGGTATAHARMLRGGEFVKEGMQTKANSHVMEVQLDLSKGSAEEQLREALNKNAVRVIDLFRDWDVNGDGVISRAEFMNGVRMLGLPGGSEAGILFDRWDVDGSGTLEIRELNKFLRRGVEMAGVSGRAPYLVNLTARRNWSLRKIDGASGVVVHLNSDSALMRGALKARPSAAAAYDAWRQAGSYLQDGRMPPAGSPRPEDSSASSPSLRRPAQPRSPEQVVADLLSKQTAASALKSPKKKKGRRPLSATDDALYAAVGGESAPEGSFLPRVASSERFTSKERPGRGDGLDAGPRRPVINGKTAVVGFTTPIAAGASVGKGTGCFLGGATAASGNVVGDYEASRRPRGVGSTAMVESDAMRRALRSYDSGVGGSARGGARAPVDAAVFFGLGSMAEAVYEEAFGPGAVYPEPSQAHEEAKTAGRRRRIGGKGGGKGPVSPKLKSGATVKLVSGATVKLVGTAEEGAIFKKENLGALLEAAGVSA